MKKGLLLLSAALATGALSLSAKNGVIDNFYTMKLSPDGTYLFGYNDSEALIRNLKTGQEWSYNPENYNEGNGNCWTADGMLVGNVGTLPGIWKDGKWTTLDVSDKTVSYTLRGVTPDGAYICGTVGLKTPTGNVEDYLMAAPAVWERQADGSYGDPILLPYPEKDITNRIPQYVTANNISDDGKTIVGQVVDGRGMLTFPIAYHKQSDGSWTYDMVLPDLVNPQNVTFPEYPGQGPMMPQPEAYLTPDEFAAYMDAMDEWEDQGSDYNSEPWPENFLGEQSKKEYEDAMKAYTEKQLVWETNFIKWIEAYDNCAQNGCTFVYNDIFLSPDGTLLGLNDKKEYDSGIDGPLLAPAKKTLNLKQTPSAQDGNASAKWTPVVIDLTKDSYKKYETDFYNGIEMTGITADKTVLGVNEPQPYPQAYLFPQGGDNFVSLHDYITTVSQTTADWMNDNMTHDVEMYNPENDNYELVEGMMISGIPVATPDMKTIVTTVYALWTAFGDPYYSYVLTPDDPNAVQSIAAPVSELKVSLASDGTLTLSAPADVAVYDLTGKTRFEAENVTSAATGLSNGIYVVKATDGNGNTVTVKRTL